MTGKRALDRRWWLGGSPCAGKSTVAARLAARLGAAAYHADDHFDRHAAAADEKRHPTLHAIPRMSADEIWLAPVEEQVARALRLQGEVFEHVLADLQPDPEASFAIAEGAVLLPERVAPLLRSPAQALWLLPSEAFQREHYAQRGWARGVVERTSDPDLAFERWMQRDVRFADEVRRQVLALGLTAIEVDGSATLEEVEARAWAHFVGPDRGGV